MCSNFWPQVSHFASSGPALAVFRRIWLHSASRCAKPWSEIAIASGADMFAPSMPGVDQVCPCMGQFGQFRVNVGQFWSKPGRYRRTDEIWSADGHSAPVIPPMHTEILDDPLLWACGPSGVPALVDLCRAHELPWEMASIVRSLLCATLERKRDIVEGRRTCARLIASASACISSPLEMTTSSHA